MVEKYLDFMSRKIYNKLIRDKVPELIKKRRAVPKISKRQGIQFRQALKEKLVEEANELLVAKTTTDVMDELSDILQLVESIAHDYRIFFEEIVKQKNKKKKIRGAFEKKLFLKYVDES